MNFEHLTHPAPVPGETRQQALQDPGFGKLFTDHMVVIDYDADKGGWHSPLKTSPAITSACARVRLSTSPRSTSI